MVNAKKSIDESNIKNESTKSKIFFVATRNISFLSRHLMKDLLDIMPYIKSGNKFSIADGYIEIKQLCEERNVDKLVIFEENPLNKENMFLWISNESVNGPSIKFVVDNMYSIAELKLSGDCINGSKVILSFSSNFDDDSTDYSWKITKCFLTDIFATPLSSKKTKNVCDRIMTFTLLGDRVWVRHYQINVKFNCIDEIGPRFAMKPILIRGAALSGKVLYQDEHFVNK